MHHICMTGSTYVKEKGDVGGSSASMTLDLMSSRTHRRAVVMDSYTLLPSSELFLICSKANNPQVVETKPMTRKLIKLLK